MLPTALRSSLCIAVLAGCASAAYPPEQWLATLEADIATFHALEASDPQLSDIYLGCNLSINHAWGDQKFPSAYAAQFNLYTNFMDSGEGHRILTNWLATGTVAPADMKYYNVIMAAYLRTGKDIDDNSYGTSARLHYLALSPAEQLSCSSFYVNSAANGKAALTKGYTQRMLDSSDFNAIRLYKLRECMQWGDEEHLPMHFDLHPYTSHRLSDCMGQPYFGLKLRTLSAAFGLTDYTDHLDYEFAESVNVRPEGLLEYLRPLTAFRPVHDGRTYCLATNWPTMLQPGENSNDFTWLSDHVGSKPLIIYFEDVVDGNPCGAGFPLASVIYEAYRDWIEFIFVGTTIHDWHLRIQDYMTPGHSPSTTELTHYWSEAERARRLKNYLMLHPQVTFPIVIDSMGQAAENFYLATGGANKTFVIGPDGLLAGYTDETREMAMWANLFERQLWVTLTNGGERVPDLNVEARNDLRCLMPRRITAFLNGASVESVDTAGGTLQVTTTVNGAARSFTIAAGPRCRIMLDGRVEALADVSPGQTIDVEFFLDGYLPGVRGPIDYMDDYWNNSKLHVFTHAGRTVTVKRVTDSYVKRSNYARYQVMEDTVPAQTVTARRVIKGDNKWSSKIWMYARVLGVSPAEGRLVVQRRAIDTNRFHGYIFKQSTSGVHLDATANNRMEIVTDWATGADGDGIYTLAVDDSCDIILNGLYMNDLSTLVSGDLVGVQYTCNQRGNMTLYPDTLRASRLESLRTNGLDAACLAMPPALTSAWDTTTVDLQSTVVIDGLTGMQGPATGVAVEIGYGPVGSPPATDTSTWTWVVAAYSAAGMESDWYTSAVTPSVTGVFDVALRVRAPGKAWTYADRDGAWNGYSFAATGKLVSQVPEPATAALALAIAAVVTARSGTSHTPDVALEDSGLRSIQ